MQRSLSLGFLAMAPMLAAYEAARSIDGARNTCEFLLTLPLDLLGGGERWVRWTLLSIATLVALWIARSQGARVRVGVARIVLEGCAGAAIVGPLLVAITQLAKSWLPVVELEWSRPASAPGFAEAVALWGGGAWEELFFRVGLYSLIYLLSLRALQALALEGAARWFAEAFALVASALLFAAFHLEALTGWIGVGGEPFDAAVFTWRASAGFVLALIFRLRGPGVAAWTHGLFNVALLIGIGPHVIL